MVEQGATAGLPWQQQALAEALAHQRGHALLLHGSPGNGSFEFALALAQSWLCESGGSRLACGECGGCRLVQSRTHPDLRLCMPEEEALAREWPVAVDEKRKPSRQIRIDDVRTAIDWIVTTPSRGRAKVLLVFPAEAMNAAAGSALLKTLEEPPEGVRLLLCAADPAHLMPTVRSRCQRMRLPVPSRAQAIDWLGAEGVADAGVLLDAAGGEPLGALGMHARGVGSGDWSALPRRLIGGDSSALVGLGVPAALDALAKLGHDAAVAAAGGRPRYFPAGTVPAHGSLGGLVAWHRTLAQVLRHAEHPWHEALVIEALVAEMRVAFGPAAARGENPMDTLKV